MLAVLEGNNISTRDHRRRAAPGITFAGSTTAVRADHPVGRVVVIYWFLSRTVFGFSIKATGLSRSRRRRADWSTG